jgi:hypothetical protein
VLILRVALVFARFAGWPDAVMAVTAAGLTALSAGAGGAGFDITRHLGLLITAPPGALIGRLLQSNSQARRSPRQGVAGPSWSMTHSGSSQIVAADCARSSCHHVAACAGVTPELATKTLRIRF